MPATISSRSAHDATNPREKIPDITATGINTISVNSDLETQPDLAVSSSSTADLSATQSQPNISSVLPPLIFGTATFNYQFTEDPYALHPNEIISTALSSGIRAFDTSPYYGPAELILGEALHSPLIQKSPTLRHLKREDYFILTKAGRISADEFDYSPDWIRHSVRRSLRRLKTTYLDIVYLHDVEFVSPAEVLTGIQTLRSIRNTDHTIKYIGICGYPVSTLCSLAELILNETGQPVDIVQSYANFTIHNQTLLSHGLEGLKRAGVDTVTNASPLGMGLCRAQGPPVGAMGDWHPAPDELRAACLQAAQYVHNTHNERLETIAIRFAMEQWLTSGSSVGSQGLLPDEATAALFSNNPKITTNTNGYNGIITTHGEQARPRLGVSVMGISKLSELREAMEVYNSILAAHFGSDPSSGRGTESRKEHVKRIAAHIREHILGPSWTDFAWASPDAGFVNRRQEFGVSEADLAADRAEVEAEASRCTGG